MAAGTLPAMSAGHGETPLVSVGFPVFNEEEHLPRALDSILGQDYEHLEVIVCDNASTDRTVEIAREYERRDPRVTLHRNERNEGSVANFNRCFELASGPYFTWASGHDERLPAAIRRCVEVLEEDPRVVLCYPRALWHRFDGSTEPVEGDTIETRGLSQAARLRKTVEELGNCNAVHGVIRSPALARTRLARRCHGADTVLLAELSLLGGFHQLDERLFVRTENRPPEEEAEEERIPRILDHIGVTKGLGRSRPYSVMVVEHMKGAWHVSEGLGKPANALRVPVYCWRNWHRRLKEEWHVPANVRGSLRGRARRLLRAG